MTLTQAAVWTKRGVLGIIISIVLGTATAVGYNLWYQYQLSHRPPVEEKPEIKFGQLPELQFPPSKVTSSNFSYSVDTVTGGLPQTPKLIKVYFIPQTGVSLLAPERSKTLAENLGFTSSPEILSPTRYKFGNNKGGNLIIDLPTGNFHFQRLISTDSAQLQNAPFENKENVLGSLKDYLYSKNLLVEELKSGRTNVTFDALSLAEAETVTASLWPSDLDSLPIVTATFNHGLVKAVLTKAKEETDKFIKVDYTFWPIDKTTSSTYPTKTAEEAFDNLRSGQGFVALEPSNPQVSITSVYLAYFESEEYSPYLQPVFVFEGPGFAALVPAIAK